MSGYAIDKTLVDLCAAIYEGAGTTQWDHLDKGADDLVYWGLKKLPEANVVVFRGSITFNDWLEDFKAVPIETKIGTVHEGFYEGMEKQWGELQALLTDDKPVYVTGHSLGAARADILCGLMVVDNKSPARRVVFGEPHPGLPDFAKLIASLTGTSYCNGDSHGYDRVCDVPFKLWGEFDFVHPTRPVRITANPTGNLFEKEGLFAYHHIWLYQAAITKLCEGTT
jgi:hypothetical protein